MSNTNTEVLTTAYENLQKAITQANTVLPPLQEAIKKGNLDNYATTSDLEENANEIEKNKARAVNADAFGSSANSERLKLAIEYCKNNGGGTVYCNSNKYIIDQYINIPLGVNFDGGFAEFEPATDFTGFMFGINSQDGITWDVQYPNAKKGYITRLILKNSDKHENVKGLFVAGQYNIENISAYGMTQTIQYVGSYLDSRYISRVTTDECVGEYFQFDLSNMGDAVILEGLTGTSTNILKMYACNGASINSCILHGNIEINDCSAINITGGHSEGNTTIKIKNSEIELSNMFIWKHDNVIPIQVLNEYNSSKPTILENIKIVYPTYNNKLDYNDIDLSIKGSSPITIRNVTKRYEHRSRVASSYEFGITTDNENFNKNKARNSIYSIVTGDKGVIDTINCIDNQYQQYQRYFLDKVELEESTLMEWDIEKKTYYYNSILLIDNERKLGTFSEDNEKTVTITDGKLVRFINQKSSKKYLIGNTLRLYRGSISGNYNMYVDLPICGTVDMIKYDRGTSISKMFKWRDRESSGVDKINKCYKYEFKGENIIAWCDDKPTIGSWKKGDIVYKQNPTSGNYIGWLCITEGDFESVQPVFKGFGMIES